MEVLLFHLPTAVNMPIGTQSFNQEPPCSNGKTMGTATTMGIEAQDRWESKPHSLQPEKYGLPKG